MLADNYPIAFDKDAARTHNTRLINGVGLGSQYISFGDTKKMYADQTLHSFVVKAGATVDPSIDFAYNANNGAWMDGYVYIDRNRNGQFDVTVPGASWKLDGANDLVSYSGLTLSDKTLYNSAGVKLDNLSDVEPPAFQAPTEPGFYYMRYKVDWDSSDPAGRVDNTNNIITNGGGIIDVRLRVYGNDSTATVTARSDHGKVVFDNGDELTSRKPKLGSSFTVSIRPNNGYVVSDVTLRHGILSGDSIYNKVAQYTSVTLPGDTLDHGLLAIPETMVDGDVEITVNYEPATIDVAAPSYQLVFSDEFDTDGQPDPKKWATSNRSTAAWNRFVTDADSLAFVKDGSLVLRCVKNGNTAADNVLMVSGAKETKGKFSFTYGKVDIRMKTRRHTGNFPAAWMMPQPPCAGWPNAGEIDIFETIDNQNTAYHTIHSNWSYNLHKTGNPRSSGNEACTVEQWHVYGVEWDSKQIRWYLDGKQVFSYAKSGDNNARNNKQWPFDHPFYIILNQSVGMNTWASNPDPSFEYESQVDYVRVWQLKNADGSDFVPFDTLTTAKPDPQHFADGTKWRRLTIHAGHYPLIYTKDYQPISLTTTTPSNSDEALWCIVKTEKGKYQIYNKKAGPEKILVSPKTVGEKNGLNMYPVVMTAAAVDTATYVKDWTEEDVTCLPGENGFLMKQDGTGYAMNKRGDNLAFWTTGVDGGSTLVFSAPITVTTGIEVINASSTTRKAGDRWYDLSGRVVSKPQKGIYINNGKKVVIQ
jgi:beta-glucanase (GH16 family)